jgi:hypothetical protein
MIRAHSPAPDPEIETKQLFESVRVLAATVVELSERIEILEAREVLGRTVARPAVDGF